MRTFRTMTELRRALFPKAEEERKKAVKRNPFPERKEIVSIHRRKQDDSRNIVRSVQG